MSEFLPHSSHWGVFRARREDGRLSVRPHAADAEPNPLIRNFQSALSHPVRVARPAIRRRWLERGPGPDDRRGDDEFVEVPWDTALDRLAAELARVRDQHGSEAVYGGSYGWSSAGRFHHAQSQLHRFLNVALGGYVRSVNTYSSGAAQVILPHVIGHMDDVSLHNVSWEQIVEHTQVVLAFGGMPLRNSRVATGGAVQHIERQSMQAAARRGCRFVLVSPIRSDLPQEAAFGWMSIVPGTDTALMLALMHTLVADGLHDRHFLDQYCDGWPQFEAYLRGDTDGVAKSAFWAAQITGIDAGQITTLARSLAGRRCLVVVAHALQRAEHGEQPVWAGVALAAVLGQPGLPGGGFQYALGSIGKYGRRRNLVSVPALPQGINRVQSFIPVARVADMLLKPGSEFDYNGQTLRYPHVRLAYWAGGNPFHHHQDLSRLREAIRRLDTFVVHESVWTATARFADIVLPATMTLEREDLGASQYDPYLIAMHRIAPPHEQARDDYDIFSQLAARLGAAQAFTEGRSAADWLRRMYEQTREALAGRGVDAPPFDVFWQRGELVLPQADDDGGPLRAFRGDPAAHPLRTPSGRIQITSPAVAAFGYADCPGHPAWLEPSFAPDPDCPLHLVANQPAGKLHSQLDFGDHSAQTKVNGREVCTLHPRTAMKYGIAQADVVRISTDRGACLASAHLSEGIRENVLQLSTGAWFDPVQEPSGLTLCVHGNPNAVTLDRGTSRLAQGCIGQLTAVRLERYDGPERPIRAFTPPSIS
ncbi:MAG: molybdopterin-dependent oxidoreductase [Burkholderiaceae bacterium]